MLIQYGKETRLKTYTKFRNTILQILFWLFGWQEQKHDSVWTRDVTEVPRESQAFQEQAENMNPAPTDGAFTTSSF